MSFFSSIRRFFVRIMNKAQSDNASHLYTLSVVVCIVAIVLLVWFLWRLVDSREDDVDFFSDTDHSLSEEKESADVIRCPMRRLLDGVCVDTEEAINPDLVAVMIENNIEARPLSGISNARVVYEAPVEGHITRFMALYVSTDIVSKVGPVRSARPYYLDWLAEYAGAMYMHVGGSPDALALIEQRDVFDMNEFYRGWYFWRSTDRYAPHNTYTSSLLWNKAVIDYGNAEHPAIASPWLFDSYSLCNENCATHISLSYLSSSAYSPEWYFSSTTEQYTRYESKKIVRDDNGSSIVADTVIVQRVTARVIDDVGRLSLETIGSGDALIFTKGHVILGTWKKDALSGRTMWFYDDGTPIALSAGVVWISIASQYVDVSYE